MDKRDDFFDCMKCHRVTALLEQNKDRTHCPNCGSDNGTVVSAKEADKLFKNGVYAPIDSSGKRKTTKHTRRR